MQNALRFVPLFAVAALIVTGNLSASHAANCEASLKPTYACTASLSSGQSVDYCLRPDVDVPGEGRFGLHEDSGVGYYCTCEAKGKTPSVQFGVSSRDFFCADFDGLAVAGRITPTRITGQGYSLNAALRSVFTCQAVAACP